MKRPLRRAKVAFQGVHAGVLEETENGYRFAYDSAYIRSGGCPIGFRFPLTQRVYEFRQFPAFFDNLVSEGWMRRLQSQTQRISEDDRFGLLLANGRDLVGAVTVTPSEDL